MSKISEHIFGLYSQLIGDEIQPIDENVVDEAMDVINKINVTDANSLFYFLSAINLLNAAIRTDIIIRTKNAYILKYTGLFLVFIK